MINYETIKEHESRFHAVHYAMDFPQLTEAIKYIPIYRQAHMQVLQYTHLWLQ